MRAGEAVVTTTGRQLTVRAGQALRLSGNEEVAADFVDTPELDPWDNWCLSPCMANCI